MSRKEHEEKEHLHFLHNEQALDSASSPLTWLISEAIIFYLFHNYGANREEDFGIKIPQATSLLRHVDSFPKNTAIARKSVTGGPLTGEYVHSFAFLSRIRNMDKGPCPELMSNPIDLPEGFSETTKELSLHELIELINSGRVRIKSIKDNTATFVDDKWNGELAKCKKSIGGEYQISFSIDFNGKASENAFRQAFVEHRADLFKDPAEATNDSQLHQLCEPLKKKNQTHCGFPVYVHTTVDNKESKEHSGPLKIIQHTASKRVLRSDIDIGFVSLPSKEIWPGAAERFNIAKEYTEKEIKGDDEHRAEQIQGLQAAIKKMLGRALDERPLPYEDKSQTAFRLHVFNAFLKSLDPQHDPDKDVTDDELKSYAEKVYRRFASSTYIGEGSAILVLQSVMRGFLNNLFLREKLGNDLVNAICEIDKDNGEKLRDISASLNRHQADSDYSPPGKSRKVPMKPIENLLAFIYKKINKINPETQKPYSLDAVAELSDEKIKQFIFKLVEIYRLPEKKHVVYFYAIAKERTNEHIAVSTRYGLPKTNTEHRRVSSFAEKNFWTTRRQSALNTSSQVKQHPSTENIRRHHLLTTDSLTFDRSQLMSGKNLYSNLAYQSLLTSGKKHFANVQNETKEEAANNLPGMVNESDSFDTSSSSENLRDMTQQTLPDLLEYFKKSPGETPIGWLNIHDQESDDDEEDTNGKHGTILPAPPKESPSPHLFDSNQTKPKANDDKKATKKPSSCCTIL